ncbi:MAG: uracil-DNA glycosylase [Arenicella sp.]|nr:uracil-DNA glycosylase [Arenicella sp.]
MSTLDHMGIQRWRLRRPQKPIEQFPNSGEILETVPRGSVEENSASAIDNMDWERLREFVCQSAQCVSCAQSSPILGEGNIEADWVFLIDAPSVRDIEQQELLTGRGGLLFNGILAALGLQREDVYLTSAIKCPPNGNSTRAADCEKVIHRQISLIQPRIVVAFGEFAAQSVIKANEALGVLRGQPQQCFINKLPIIPTHSLSEVLREPVLKAELWHDLKKANALLSP